MSKMNALPKQKKTAFITILRIGLLAGVLDATAAIISYVISPGGNPIRIFQYIASAVFGKRAFSGGLPMAFAGLIFHFIIAYIFTIIFFLAYPKFKLLSKNIIFTGIIYGIIVWLVMNRIVLPIVNLGSEHFNLTQAVTGIVIIVIAVGIPIALLTHRYYKNKRTV